MSRTSAVHLSPDAPRHASSFLSPELIVPLVHVQAAATEARAAADAVAPAPLRRSIPELPSVSRPLSGADIAPANCSTCMQRNTCISGSLDLEGTARINELVHLRRRIKAGQSLYRAGDSFRSLYTVHRGFFKSSMMFDDGMEQVTEFHMAGEIMGLDGIADGIYASTAVALDDAEVCVIPYAALDKLCVEMPQLRQHLHRLLSRELQRRQEVMLLLGTLRTEQRLAAFLLNLSQRLLARGYSASEFHMRMSREEIGCFLGMKLETVSRLFSRFHDEGLLEVGSKHIRILDIGRLEEKLGRAMSRWCRHGHSGTGSIS